MLDKKRAQELSWRIRYEVSLMVHRAKASHIASCFSCADILSVLFSSIIQEDDIEESFLLSKGHACAALYAALFLLKKLDKSTIETFGQDGSILMSHASHHVVGIGFSTGSLGHGLPIGVGKATARKRQVNGKDVYVLISEGELNEGSSWEAIMLAGNMGLSNLVLLIDYNRNQSFGELSPTLEIEPLAKKLEAFKWSVSECDGHCVVDIYNKIHRKNLKTPHAIVCKTTKGFPISFMRNNPLWHYRNPDDTQLATILEELESYYK